MNNELSTNCVDNCVGESVKIRNNSFLRCKSVKRSYTEKSPLVYKIQLVR